jgi:hypothetical protein
MSQAGDITVYNLSYLHVSQAVDITVYNLSYWHVSQAGDITVYNLSYRLYTVMSPAWLTCK